MIQERRVQRCAPLRDDSILTRLTDGCKLYNSLLIWNSPTFSAGQPLQRSLSSDLLRQLDLALSHIWRKTTNQSKPKEQWAIRWNGMTEWGHAGVWVEGLLRRNGFSRKKVEENGLKWECKKKKKRLAYKKKRDLPVMKGHPRAANIC